MRQIIQGTVRQRNKFVTLKFSDLLHRLQINFQPLVPEPSANSESLRHYFGCEAFLKEFLVLRPYPSANTNV